MILRGRGAVSSVGPTPRKEPLADSIFFDEIGRAFKSGRSEDKVRAILRLSSRLDEGSAPRRETGDFLRQAIRDSDKAVKWNAMIAMARHGSDFVPELCEGLSNDDPRVRAMSAAMVKSVLDLDPPALSPASRTRTEIARMLVAASCSGDAIVGGDALSALERIARMAPIEVLDELERAPESWAPRLGRARRDAMDALESAGRKNPC